MILVAGEALIDLLVNADGAISAVPGGGPFNVARALARLGCPVAFLGRLSSDGFGRELRRALVDDGVLIAIEKPVDAPTTLALGRLDRNGRASYAFYSAGTSAAALTPGDIAASSFDGVDHVHVGSLGLVVEPMASAVRHLVHHAPAGVPVVVDVNARPAAIEDLQGYRRSVLDLLPRAYVVKASREDLALLLPQRAPVEAARDLVAAGAGVVLVTDGPDPVHVIGPGFVEEVVVPVVPVLDTVGAGDAFGAGFLAWWRAHGYGRARLGDLDTVVEAARRAAEVAASTCTRKGADPPHRAELSPGW